MSSSPDKQHTRVAAYGLVTEGSKMLLCRISENIKDHAGHWTLPGGGIDFAESPQDAMVREVFEETGLRVSPTKVADVNSLLLTDENDHSFHGIRIIYETHLEGGELRNEVDGSTDRCAWLEPDEIKELTLVGLATVGVRLVFGPNAA